MTPKSVVARRPIGGILACTNHFRSEELAVPLVTLCPRYGKLIQSRKLDQLGVADVAKKLREVGVRPDDGADDDFRAGRAQAALGDRLLPLLGAAAEAAGA